MYSLVNRKLGYTSWQWEEEIIVLSMDHLQLPLTILIRKMNITNFVDIFLSSNTFTVTHRHLTSF